MDTLRQPLVRALIVTIGFSIVLATFIFFTEPPGVLIGSAFGLIVMLLPFGFGGRIRPTRRSGGSRGASTREESR